MPVANGFIAIAVAIRALKAHLNDFQFLAHGRVTEVFTIALRVHNPLSLAIMAKSGTMARQKFFQKIVRTFSQLVRIFLLILAPNMHSMNGRGAQDLQVTEVVNISALFDAWPSQNGENQK